MQNIEDASCKEYRSLILDYVSDNLTEFEKDKLMLHIKSCPECEREFGEIQHIIDAASDIPEVEVPDTLRRAVSAEIAATAEAMHKRKKIYKFAVGTLLPVAACAVLAIGIFSGGFYDRIANIDNMVTMETPQLAGEGVSAPKTDGMGAETQTEKDAKIPADTNINNQTKKSESGSALADAAADKTASQTEASASVSSASEEVLEAATQIEDSNESNGYVMGRSVSDSGGGATGAETENADNGISMASAFMLESDADNAEGQITDEGRGVPISCIVIAENPAEFVAGFGIAGEGDEITFELSADKWIAFVSYNRECGTKLEAEFSGRGTDVIYITVKSE